MSVKKVNYFFPEELATKRGKFRLPGFYGYFHEITKVPLEDSENEIDPDMPHMENYVIRCIKGGIKDFEFFFQFCMN